MLNHRFPNPESNVLTGQVPLGTLEQQAQSPSSKSFHPEATSPGANFRRLRRGRFRPRLGAWLPGTRGTNPGQEQSGATSKSRVEWNQLGRRRGRRAKEAAKTKL